MAVTETPGSTTRGAAYTTEGSTKRLKSIRATANDAHIHAITRAIVRKPSTANAAPVRRLRSGVSITAGLTFGDQNGTSHATLWNHCRSISCPPCMERDEMKTRPTRTLQSSLSCPAEARLSECSA